MSSLLLRRWALMGEQKLSPLYLYKDGDLCTAVTGGWKRTHLANYGDSQTWTLTPDRIKFEMWREGSIYARFGGACTVNKIKNPGYKYLNFHIARYYKTRPIVEPTFYNSFGATESGDDVTDWFAYVWKRDSETDVRDLAIRCDVSSFDEFFVRFYASFASNAVDGDRTILEVDKVWLSVD